MKFYKLLIITLLLYVVFPSMSNADQLEDANTAIKNKEYKKAFELFQPLAEEGNAEAQTRLGAMYINGQGVDSDPDKGLSWIMKAANQGYETARTIAFKVCLDLVNQGDTTVMYNLGYMCLDGWGGEHDTNDCLGWLENAGRIGHEKSSKLLARIYTEGLYSITPDEEKATYWSNLAAGFAAGIDGKWEGSISMVEGQPPVILSYYFKRDGDRLTGTTAGYRGQKMRIQDGKIDGNNFSFTVRSNLVKINYTGTFYGDMIKLTYTTEMSVGGGRKSSSANKLRDTGGGVFLPPVTFTVKRIE